MNQYESQTLQRISSMRRSVSVACLLVLGCAWIGVTGPALASETADALRVPTAKGDLVIIPIKHATFAMTWDGKTIFVDPVGGAGIAKNLSPPQLVLLTDIHRDHLDEDTLDAIGGPEATVVAPPAVHEKLSEKYKKRTTVLRNGEKSTFDDIQIEAIPMYNMTEERKEFHAKGRGNGYVLTLGGKRIYISGDTEDIPEMRQLEDIDVAFVCMNLPYTMTVEQAASAVREFKPKVVFPYHSRGSDLEKFEGLVGQDTPVEVRLVDWYASSE